MIMGSFQIWQTQIQQLWLIQKGHRTLSAAQILADLADGGVVSGHDESAEVSTTSEQQAKETEEVDVVNTQEVDVENTQYGDQ